MITKIKLSILIVSFIASIWLFAASPLTATSAVTAVKESGGPRSLYLQNCSTCHGANGRAQTTRGKKLEAADLTSADVQGMSRAKIIRAVTNGRPGMPGFKKKLTAKQIAQIAGYVPSF